MTFALFAATAFSQDDELLKGIGLYQQGRFEDAVVVLEKFLTNDPNHWAGWSYLGVSLANLGREQEAATAVQTKTKGYRDFKLKYDKDLKLTKMAKAGYTSKARSNGVQGSLTLVVEFKGDGTIGIVLPVSGLPDGLTENSIRAAKQISFQPAERDGKPVSVVRKVSFSFSLGR